MLRLPAALVLTATALGAAQSPRDSPAANSATVTIAGRVVAAATGDPVRNARVTIGAGVDRPPPTLTDAAGRFVFTALLPGHYTLNAAKAGFVKPSFGPRGEAFGIAIDVGAGAHVDDVELRLEKAAAISGRVTNELGEPLAMANVTAEVVGAAGGARRLVGWTLTDDLGEYRLGGLPAGSFLIGVRAVDTAILRGMPPPDFPPGSFGLTSIVVDESGAAFRSELQIADDTRAYYPGAVAVDRAQPVTVRAGEEQSAIDVTVVPVRPRLTLLADTRVADNGAAPQKLGAVRGRVLSSDGGSLSGATVMLIASPQTPPRTTVTSSAEGGAYAFSNVPPGAYTVAAQKQGFLRIEYGQRDFSDRGQKLQLGAGSSIAHIDIVLPRASIITGSIVDENGDPIEGARVTLLQRRFIAGRPRFADAQVSPFPTNDLGRYRLFNVPPGSYILRADAGEVLTSQLPGYAPTFYPGSTSALGAQPVSVDAAQQIDAIDFALVRARTARISGQIFDSTGEPWSGNLQLNASERSGTAAATWSGARIERDGRFEFPNVTPGEYVIRAFKGRRQVSIEGDFASQVVTVNGTNIDGLVIRASAGSRLTGRVTLDGAGEPPRHAIELEARPFDPDISPAGMGAFATSEVRPDWTFELVGLNGPRRLRLNGAPAGWALKAILSHGVDVTDDVLTFGTREQTVSEIELVLTDRLTRLVATAADARGRLLSDYTAIVFAVDRDKWYPDSRFVRSAASQSDGTATLQMPPGDYYVAAVERVPPNRGGDAWQDPEYLDSLSARAMRVSLTEGATATAAVTAR